MKASPWHSKTTASVLAELSANERGLTQEEAKKRLERHGPNALPEEKGESLPAIFLRQFRSPLIYVLFAAAVAIYFVGETTDSVIIFGILVFNAIVGAIQEGRAQNTLRALKTFTQTSATVLRDGEEQIIPDTQVVPGDIIVLAEGEKVPADARLLFSRNLKVDEASLTGESEAVAKDAELLVRPNAPVSEQKPMVFKGTYVVGGTARAVVTTTGAHTFIGTIAQKISSIDSEIPLKADIRRLANAIIGVVGVLSVFLIALGLFKGQTIAVMFATVVSLAVSVIPEGLPIVITLVLATGVWRMGKRNALVKRLQAVEALGQAKVIAVDKTGTLTKNEQIIQKVYAEGKFFEVSGTGYEPKGEIHYEGEVVDPANHPELLFAGKVASFCASAHTFYNEEEKRWKVAGDPTEAAMYVFGEKMGFHKTELERESPLISEIPFDSALKYHATLHRVGRKNFLVVVSAPENALEMCTSVRVGGKSRRLTNKDKEELEGVFTSMSQEGLRVLAYAVREIKEDSIEPQTLPALTLGGFFGMKDGLRPEVAEAMRRSKEAGVKVVMITGDHKATAQAIAKEAGIYTEGDEVVTGAEIETLSDTVLLEKLPSVSIFARVTPDHKLRIVELYKKSGQIIAMTGDGVNDAPSLVAADLGVSMGRIGTEVAKEASDIVLLDDNFGSIVSAIEEGRSIYKTVKKVILYLFATSAGEVLVIIGALLIGYPLPLLASQIIWLNFVTDPFLDIALAMEPKERGLLSGQFKKPGRYLLDSLMVKRMATMAVPMMIGSLVLFSFYLDDLGKALTISLTVMAVFQWFNAWNCRHESDSVFSKGLFSNPYLLGATGIVISLQLLAVYNPFLQNILHTQPLSLVEWLIIIPVAASIVVVEETRKYFVRRHVVAVQ